jgi:outer membrane protein assembly factor BamB
MLSIVALTVALVSWTPAAGFGAAGAGKALEQIGVHRGICAVLGLPDADGPEFVVELANESELVVYFQSSRADEVAAVREAADAAGLLGRRVFVDRGNLDSVHLAGNLADAVLLGTTAAGQVNKEEVLRVLHPEGKAISPGKELVKPVPDGTDHWSHVYHGPDNNPQSTDQLARSPYLTQFLAGPMFVPMPEVSVAAGGRVFRAFGHIAHKANQNAMLNTLVCANGYNGTILWKRPLKEGFMIHRNTMIATPDKLYLGDDESCKLIDAKTGEVTGEIVIPAGAADGPVWKWMALVDGVLYALVGAEEVKPPTQKSDVPGMGHWPWGMWDGHDYSDPETNFGFGRTFVAIDPTTKKILWSHDEEEYLDSRGVCMCGDRIYFYAPQKFLGCLDTQARKVLWKAAHPELLEAIGPDGRAQLWKTGYSTQTFVKCNDQYVFFAGPQRSRLVVVSTEDGEIVWQKDNGNYQLVLRDDAIYAAGPQVPPEGSNHTEGLKFAYDTGEILATFVQRRACTRATGSVDSVFFRASGGTVRIDTASDTANHIAPMRPPCHDGVIISDGFLYFGPWMCGCQLSLYGHVGLGPAGDFNDRPGLDDSRFEPGDGDPAEVKRLEVQPGDWPALGGDNARTFASEVAIPGQVQTAWTFAIPSEAHPTAPVVAGGMVFVGDRTGVVRAIDMQGKERWRAYTAGAIYCPPAVADGRLYVGSADGRVYGFEAATGRRLWSFRVAPAQRLIPVYGKLISTWPVAGGVVVEDGVVYAAAGIAHYDGTHVVALDAVTGTPKWYNDTSGVVCEKVNSGISLQGELCIRDGELQFLGGGVYETARYDLETGRCLNEPYDQPNSRFHTAYYAYFPVYGQYIALDHTLPDGRSLTYDVTYEGSRQPPLTLLGPYPPGVPKLHKPASRWRAPQFRRGQPRPKLLWQDKSGRRFNSFIVGGDVLLAAAQAGPPAPHATSFSLAAVKVEDGSDIWAKELPAAAVKGGTALDPQGRIVVALKDGRIVCFAPARP